MNYYTKLKSLLIKSGLTQSEADFYIYVLGNNNCSIADVYKNTGISKTTAYRAFESLQANELLNSDSEAWQSNLKALPLHGLIKKLENQTRKHKKNISDLKLLNSAHKFTNPSDIPNIETFKGDEIYQKYHDLAEMDFSTCLVYGSWEDFSSREDLISVEKKFIKNRLKKGGNCICLITKDGPNTHEITNYDADENRKSGVLDNEYMKPIWINAFDGNNFVFIWNMDENGKNKATLIESKQISDFYKNFIYAKAL
ncbi:helix-turn-helix domain-containing protein [Pseudomonadota bacterium]